MSGRVITLDELPRHSPWPARLLGIEPWAPRRKSPAEIEREYEREKWGPLRERALAAEEPPGVEKVDGWYLEGANQVPCWDRGRLILLPALEALGRYKDFVAQVLMEHLPASALVELGAGYGSLLLDLARRGEFQGFPLLAGEFTPSGRELLRLLAAGQDLPLEVGPCDFTAPGVTPLEIPEGALVFTSYGPSCVPRLASRCLTDLAACQPKAVVHFEPCYEHNQGSTLWDLMRRRYIEVNDYNTNLATLLHGLRDQGRLTLMREEACAFGINPLFPASVLAWTV